MWFGYIGDCVDVVCWCNERAVYSNRSNFVAVVWCNGKCVTFAAVDRTWCVIYCAAIASRSGYQIANPTECCINILVGCNIINGVLVVCCKSNRRTIYSNRSNFVAVVWCNGEGKAFSTVDRTWCAIDCAAIASRSGYQIANLAECCINILVGCNIINGVLVVCCKSNRRTIYSNRCNFVAVVWCNDECEVPTLINSLGSIRRNRTAVASIYCYRVGWRWCNVFDIYATLCSKRLAVVVTYGTYAEAMFACRKAGCGVCSAIDIRGYENTIII